jgi:hypothetical protein
MSFFYDTSAKRRYTAHRLYAVGALFSGAGFDAEDRTTWKKEPPRWFVMADGPADAISAVLDREAGEIATRSCNATVEAPKFGTTHEESCVRAEGCHRILWVSLAQDATLPAPSRIAKESHAALSLVLRERFEQVLTFRYVWVR